jgi:hypothetical protein
MMKTTFATIVLERSDLYKNICETFWDLIDEEWAPAELFDAIRTSEQMASALQGGQTPMLLGPVMDQLERLEECKAPFVIVIMDRNAVWATINGKDICW